MNVFLQATIGVITAVPILYWFIYILIANSVIAEPEFLFEIWDYVRLLILPLFIFYLYKLFSTEKIERNSKIVWLLAFLFFNVIAFQVYWWINIWKDQVGK